MFLFSISVFSQSGEKRIALVIGNSTYPGGRALKNPVNDANLMAYTLRNLGFFVIKRVNTTEQQLEDAIESFSKKLPDYDVALFYYAGHGIQVDGKNYLIPIDAELENKIAVRYETISVNDIATEFEYYPNNTNILILDACRDNPFRSWSRGGVRGFKAMNPSSGTIIAFATSAGATASDGHGTYGLYTNELVKQLNKPQRIVDVFYKTRIAVEKLSNGQQSPQEWTKLKEAFYFKKPMKSISTNPNNQSMEGKKTKDILNKLYDSRDEKSYRTIKIGKQVWMAENLAYKVYSGCWAYDLRNIKKYGYLYNWETANSVCPTGWRLPTKNDYEVLIECVGEDIGESYESLIQGGSSGFSAAFGGRRSPEGNFRSNIPTPEAQFWSATMYDNEKAWYLQLFGPDGGGAGMCSDEKKWAYAVRCLKGDYEYGSLNIKSEISGLVYLDFSYAGEIKANDLGNKLPKILVGSHSLIIIGSDTLIKTIEIHKDQTTFVDFKKPQRFFDKRDGKYYWTVEIGTQVWMAENLAFKASEGCWAYNNNNSNVKEYGYLYSWKTAKTVCPNGWRLPTKEDYEKLLNNVGNDFVERNTSLKIGGNSGFSAIPSGEHFYNKFYGLGSNASFWTLTGSGAAAWYLNMNSGFKYASVGSGGSAEFGFSIRCIKKK